MPVIKRYTNRKLYDTDSRRYVTLEEIGWMVQNGEEVRVVDHDSHEDITAVTLTQVISDLEKRLGGETPQNIFYQLIKDRSSGFSSIFKGLSSVIQPYDFVNLEIKNRLQILLDQKKIELETFSTISSLLLDEQFKTDIENSSEISTKKELESLNQQLKTLEDELLELKQKKKR